MLNRKSFDDRIYFLLLRHFTTNALWIQHNYSIRYTEYYVELDTVGCYSNKIHSSIIQTTDFLLKLFSLVPGGAKQQKYANDPLYIDKHICTFLSYKAILTNRLKPPGSWIPPLNQQRTIIRPKSKANKIVRRSHDIPQNMVHAGANDNQTRTRHHPAISC